MPERPNILVILTDQQNASMMSCAGNRYVKTPAMDRVADGGTRFERAYCTNPVCMPARFSLITGRMPSEIKLMANGPKDTIIPDDMRATGLGWPLKNAGYKTVYGGKQHFPKMTAEELGFEVLTNDSRDELASITSEFVKQDHQQPWFMFASFMNPHDICYMAIREHAVDESAQGHLRGAELELGLIDHALEQAKAFPEDRFWNDLCPPLPPNHEPQQGEPAALQALLEQRPFRQHARDNWDERFWRLHRWVYARLTEHVDNQIAQLLDALEAGPSRDNTVVIFTSDHGDHDSSHKMEHKTMPYEEAAGVPLLISTPGGPNGMVNTSDLISNGLDLYPTICDYAGVEVPPHLKGVSLRPLVEGHGEAPQRESIPIECELGCAVVTQDHKYLKCFEGERAEQHYDFRDDPRETRNAVGDPGTQKELERLRQLFTEHYAGSSCGSPLAHRSE